MAIGPHWPDPAKKIIQFPHRPRAHTPLGEAVSPTAQSGCSQVFTESPLKAENLARAPVELGAGRNAILEYNRAEAKGKEVVWLK